MSEVPSNTPKRLAIVERLRQRIDCFRKRHDSCQARLEETQPSRELKQLEESRIFQTKIMENKVKMNAKIRPEQINKLAKQEDIASNVGADSKVATACSSSNTGLQTTTKRKFPTSQVDGERGLQNNDEMSSPVPQKYARFENQNEVHCNVKPVPNFNTAEEPERLPSLTSSNMSYGAVNGHAAEFVKSEDLDNSGSYNTSACENLERTVPRAPQQYGAGDFISPTFTSRGQPGEKSRTPEFTGTFKQENGLLNPNNDSSTSVTNGVLTVRTKNDDDFRLLTDMEGNTTTSKEDDLENQLSQFERVLQGIKSRDESSNESEPTNDIIAGKTQIIRPQPLGNGLNDSVSPDIAKVNSNQLNLSNDPNNTKHLPTSSAAVQYGISRSTAQALQQFVMAQQNERLASKVRFERNLFLNPQGVGTGEQNNLRMATQRPNHIPAVRQRVYQQLQQRKNLQNLQLQKSKIAGATPQQLQARNPVMNPALGGTTAYQMHAKVRYSGISPNTQQAVSFTHAAGRIRQNLMQPLHQPANLQQTQVQGQMQGQLANLPRHQINMLAQQQQQQQQKLAYQQQMASQLPSYSQAQHLARSSSVMDIRQKFSAGVPSTHSTQFNAMHQQVTRPQQPLSHLQHYSPPGYGNQSGPPARQVQVPYSGDYPGYQHPYQYGVNQENKLHSTAFQRHASMDDNLAATRFHTPDMNNRNNFAYQRSSSLPAHAAAASTNIFNQSSPPVVRLGQNETNLPDMNNNGNDHASQDMIRVHPQAPLTHMKQQRLAQTNNLGMNQEQLYQGNAMSLAQSSRQQPHSNIQTPLSNSFSSLLDIKSSSDTSLFPFLGQDLAGGTDGADFDLLKTPSPDFDLLNMLESEPQKALQ